MKSRKVRRENSARQEFRDARDRIRVLESYIAAIESDAAFPDMVDRQLAEHRERVEFHTRMIAEITERSRPRPERLAELKTALAKSRQRIAHLKNQHGIDRVVSMRDKLAEMEREMLALGIEISEAE